jgi:TolB-like protein
MGNERKENNILQSWKEISAYLDRDYRTCQRWEIELGLPVHRIDESSSRSKVFAYRSEIDEWLKIRANNKHESTWLWKNRRFVIGSALGFFLLSVVFAWLYFSHTQSVPSLSGPSLAVFPLKNLDSSEYEEYFSEGITNEIERSLTRLNKIRVIPGLADGTSQNYAQDAGMIGRELDADYFVMGELRQVEDKIYINVSLIRTKDNKPLWNASYESDHADILNLSQRISRKIHEQLNIKVADDVFARSNNGGTGDFSAYDAFLKGNFILNRVAEQNDDPWKLYYQGRYLVGRWTPESNEMAISLFNQAIAIDNNYARPYIGLAQCYANYVNFAWDSGIEWLDTAEDLLQKAQENSPGLPEYYAALIKIRLLREDYLGEKMSPDVLSLVEESVAKYPNDPKLNAQMGYCCLTKFGETGKEEYFEKALDYNERSFWLDFSSLNNVKFAELLMLNREFLKAIEVCQLVERADPSLYSKFVLGEIYYYMSDLDKSEEIFRQFDVPLNFKIHSLYYLAMIQAQKGEAEEAKKTLLDVEFIKPEEYRDLPFNLEMASIYFGIGDEDSGYHYLESLFTDEQNQGDRFIYAKLIDIDRNFDHYRVESKFQNILRGEN